ncbi:MAG: hypothetical protein RI897_3201 [Verrucomicrobiota bacterium]|jgi:hypothetical protein
MKQLNRFGMVVGGVALLLVLAGCSGGGEEELMLGRPETSQEAAVQVNEVFQGAPPEIQEAAQVAAEGLKTGDYEKAVLSLQAIQASGNLTVNQGMAVHNSMVTLEAELIAAKQSGDPAAIAAYERWKNLKRR